MSTLQSPRGNGAQSIIERLRSRVRGAMADLDRVKQDAEQQQHRLRLTEQQLATLSRCVEVAEDRLRLADNQFEERKAELSRLEEFTKEAWGNSTIAAGPSYRLIIEQRAAIDHFPICRKHLVTKLTEAKAALEEFEKHNSK
jgi:hypothetical protein